MVSEATSLLEAHRSQSELSKLKSYQKYAFAITFGSYFMSHFSRKCYSTIKTQLTDEAGFSTTTLSEMDTVFMATYAIGSFVSGRLGDTYRPTTILGIGLFGSGACLCAMLALIYSGVETISAALGNFLMLAVYFVFGLFQSTGGPVGTAIMGAWFCDPESVANRGLIFGTWTTHQYLGDICAAICTAMVIYYDLNWTLALVIPAICNVAWAFLCLSLVPDPEEFGIDVGDVTGKVRAKSEVKGGGEPAAVVEKSPISFKDALAIPMVLSYAIAFGFFKLTNYCLFFWLPFFLSSHFDPVTANLIASLYSVGMMPGGIVVGVVSDWFGGRRGCVIGVFMCFLVPLLFVMARHSDDLPVPILMTMLACMGILVGGPNNIITSAVAADLASHPSVKGNNKSLGTVTGIINGSGSITASLGLLIIGPLMRNYGWSSIWYFLMFATVVGTLLLTPKIRKELASVGVSSKGYSKV